MKIWILFFINIDLQHEFKFNSLKIGDTTMKRTDFISVMKSQVEILKAERQSIKTAAPTYDHDYHKYTKLGHEISALENAIREMERA